MRGKTACCSKIRIKKGPWTPEEDEILTNYIKREGEGRWRTLPENAGLMRCGKSCRLRWMNYLRPNVKRGQITPEEEQLILRLHRLLGNRWSLIAGRIPGRTDNEIKNYWNTHLSKKLISQGVDPRTHMLMDPNPNFSEAYSTGYTSATNYPVLNPMFSYTNPNVLEVDQQELAGYYSVNPEQYPVQGLDQNPCSDYSAGTQSSYGNYHGNEEVSEGTVGSYGNEEEDFFNYCNNDQAFTTFLNSLMNDDNFQNQQQKQQQPPNTISPLKEDLNSSVSSAYGTETRPDYYLDAPWEVPMAPGIPSANATIGEQQFQF